MTTKPLQVTHSDTIVLQVLLRVTPRFKRWPTGCIRSS